jgi:uncharacterized protein (DUF4415 family)
MNKLSAREHERLKKLADRPDNEIDFSDIPEIRRLSPHATIGKFYRPVKEKVTVRIDSDVLAWLRSNGEGYQTRMNEYLREKMTKTLARKRRG